MWDVGNFFLSFEPFIRGLYLFYLLVLNPGLSLPVTVLPVSYKV